MQSCLDYSKLKCNNLVQACYKLVFWFGYRRMIMGTCPNEMLWVEIIMCKIFSTGAFRPLSMKLKLCRK